MTLKIVSFFLGRESDFCLLYTTIGVITVSKTKQVYGGEYRSRRNIYCTDSELEKIRAFLRNNIPLDNTIHNDNTNGDTDSDLYTTKEDIIHNDRILVTREEYEALEQAMILFYYEINRQRDFDEYIDGVIDKLDDDSVNEAWDFVRKYFRKQ